MISSQGLVGYCRSKLYRACECRTSPIRIFLSSTFIDLKDIRQEASHRLSQVLGARLIVMESFGSDDAPPVVSSVRRVRECDVFVGIYACRYGTVDPGTGKSITELDDVGRSEPDAEVLLERLIDLRLVRHIGQQYEVAHDFLAHEISQKLVDAEEREFKRFRELLTSKAAAFTTSRGLLTVEEVLMLFHHKERVLPSEDELRLIVASWARMGVPGLYWIMNCPPSRCLEIIRDEERKCEIEDDDRAMLALLRRKLSMSPLHPRDWLLFRRYKLGIELARLLLEEGERCPGSVVMFALRSKHINVRAAAIEALGAMIASG